eukprot:NODE_2871_length_1076_cov_28.175975_g2739_i0.p2 GENE.NODE_2871_length_1076_cov_28.175975_g2739_i0~~NODE_2871_length_1076_cov_28.175975_g2739_i0.p2  ORF type:complete len:298 (-),score=34.23 NODE_2871_length_1076_cov_28.175975_g2739_i0:182-1027(-)
MGSATMVTELLRSRVAPDAELDTQTPLCVAIRCGHRHVAYALIAAGASLDQSNGEGQTPVYWACVRNEVELLTTLLERRASADSPNLFGQTPLMIACMHNHPGVVRTLLAARAAVNQKDLILRQSAVHWACQSLELIRPLVYHNADLRELTPPTHPSNIITPHIPSDVCEFLNAVRDWPPLHFACALGDSRAILRLLREGSDPSFATRGVTASMAAHSPEIRHFVDRLTHWSPTTHHAFPPSTQQKVSSLLRVGLCGLWIPLELIAIIVAFLPRSSSPAPT